eukprot:11544911-Alexandrium_andersonii.AAC.1
MKGRQLEEDAETCSLDQLLPDDFRRALGDKPELQSYSERLLSSSADWGLRSTEPLLRRPPPRPP